MNDVIHYQDFDELLSIIDKSNVRYNKRTIKKAYEFANLAHGDQRRVSGVPFILHPTSVACILAEMGMDTDSIVAALLHDTVEDTPVTLEQVRDNFGEEVMNLVDGLTKISKIKFTDREERQAENVRKMLIAMSNDIRVIIVKLADRLHNMRTIECVKDQKRRDKALECMEVYAPIAHRLGMKAVKDELEDLSMRYLDPVAYSEIENKLRLTENERNAFIEEIKKKILDKIGNSISHVTISGRVKSVVSIYRKTIMQGKDIDQIFDVFAVRVIVNTIADCYNVLGLVHDLFTPLPNRFKDYISTPKANMYQSLHTTVFGTNGIPFEVQIRTYEMHHTAEYGIAAHWKYKLKIKGSKQDQMMENLEWIRKMIEVQNDAEDAEDIVKTIKYDLSTNEVYVFTPKGDIINLPAGSTVIDMAYAIHSGVGNRMVGAKVNGRIVPIDYQVKSGDIVEILTQKEGSGPKRDWLKIVKTNSARTKIRQWFKKEKREENIVEGKAMFERELKKQNIRFPEDEMEEALQPIIQRHHCNSLDDFYASIGYGGIQVWKVMPRVKEIYNKRYKDTEEPAPPTVPEKPQKASVGSGVIIEGLDDCLIKYSRCCNPLPGDDIIGYVTRGFGVSIHKRSCTNVPKDLSACEEPERWKNAYWGDNIHDSFQSTLEIVCNDRSGFLADVTRELFNMHIFINSLNTRDIKNNQAIVTVAIKINSMEHLQLVITHLSQIDGVISITRV
ncbi:MAG: bifunctional (p)ppGpp synthetase/guanosine-3',5'-bis(diphosphate) 3'-pyrophosphohydrolase [Ruminococcus sp.]|uniref:RelA/SpoT family protein n=1 Tax=Ruminococcus sp. TaxID=41978 RepID=UPI0028738257|nr:bifunctional (p)ppGpp synthetase/guanosine-3',5'-bis(diphosphate) 3'-pyrophosphohydrolase [Ruminococcus sp.]MBQ3286195.1 bifunctional (p)ppGpp synthetase/guanosine-3',5'-bis(diphosphate) 3'-pyrophosphohydrolase [Ruminococcus sp.]